MRGRVRVCTALFLAESRGHGAGTTRLVRADIQATDKSPRARFPRVKNLLLVKFVARSRGTRISREQADE